VNQRVTTTSHKTVKAQRLEKNNEIGFNNKVFNQIENNLLLIKNWE